jgi:hypothetical protein
MWLDNSSRRSSSSSSTIAPTSGKVALRVPRLNRFGDGFAAISFPRKPRPITLKLIARLTRRIPKGAPPANKIAANSVLDAGEIAEAEALLELLGICRNHASELAISEMTTRVSNDVQQYLDTTTPVLLDALRGAGAAERPFRQSQLDAAMRFSAKVFGKEYAVLLAKAAEVAANSERKAAARA